MDSLNKLTNQLITLHGQAKGTALSAKYKEALPANYLDKNSVTGIADDIAQMEKLSTDNSLQISYYNSPETPANQFQIKFFHLNTIITLSDVMPILENLGLRILSESTHEIDVEPHTKIWINDFSIEYANAQIFSQPLTQKNFSDAFLHIWLKQTEDDGLNKLILSAAINWHEVAILRAYCKYLQQARVRFNQEHIQATLTNYPDIARNLIALFLMRFNPAKEITILCKETENLIKNIQQAIEQVTNLDDDKILQYFLHLIKATLRTNYFQRDTKNNIKNYLALKFSSTQVPELPAPVPWVEIFVYAPHFEGIHLRSARVARGGIRWSNRHEDFRTEILDLMKTQTVKNASIVPSGAKGGFVIKNAPPDLSREQLHAEAVRCYTDFIAGLLDLTDNIQLGEIIRPTQTQCYDETDPYLVVAADKGTASFSDLANSIAKKYKFWLGDGFASGGSAGYDHKKMGITARGAWESVKRHFRELNININTTDFTAVGIGDMSGDVFGNGMLYTKHIKLIAAFDHRHIFLDPQPDASVSFQERERLFNLPASSWEDYDKKLISSGGGVFKRSSKSITISPEVKAVLQITDDRLDPDHLISAILKAPIDLLWNGGIGTYVKATEERNAEVLDKTNDFIRINGNELRCRVVGEGGNLGFTQLGRIEYALKGGLIYADFIDNSAGVDCSDHEVNIKILLNEQITLGNLSEEQRNLLLNKMTNEVAMLVLRDNYTQSLAISSAAAQANNQIELYQDYLKVQELQKHINRAEEFLPSEKILLERKVANQGLTRPELAILMAHEKINLKREILESEIPEDPYFSQALFTAFPPLLRKSHAEQLKKHKLNREIIATQISSNIINNMGITFVYLLQQEMGVNVAEIVRAYTIAAQVFKLPELMQLIESLDDKIAVKTQYELIRYIQHLMNISTRWFLLNSLTHADMENTITIYGNNADLLSEVVPTLMGGVTREYSLNLVAQFNHASLAAEIAERLAACRGMYSVLNITEVSIKYRFDIIETAKVYFSVGSRFNLLWFRDQLNTDFTTNFWNNYLARMKLRDELDTQQKLLTTAIMKNTDKSIDPDIHINAWESRNSHLMNRWKIIQTRLQGAANVDFLSLFITLGELSNLTRNTV